MCFHDKSPRGWLITFVFIWPALSGATFSFHVMGDDQGSWPVVLSSIGLKSDAVGAAGVVVAPAGSAAPAAEWMGRVEHGTLLVLEGESALAAAFGFRPSAKPHVVVSQC